MKKLIGIFVFMVLLYLLILGATDSARWGSNSFNLGQRIGLSGILCLGAGLLIITGGVDLSIGSVVGLCACAFSFLVLKFAVWIPPYTQGWAEWATPWIVLGVPAFLVMVLGALVGAVNGLVVTYLRVQAFVVTLCGLFIYRGAARSIAQDQIPPIAEHVAGVSEFFQGQFLWLPIYVWLLLGLFAVATIFLHGTVYGRYFFAIGSNEKAAHYSGINVDAYKIFAYVICSGFAALYSLMYVIHYNTVQPAQTGNFMELYAIAGAVLGGCSLRGGEGSTLGMLIGTSILILLPNLTNMCGVPSQLEPTVIGTALLFCAILDEQLRRGLTWRDVFEHIWYGHRWKYFGVIVFLGICWLLRLLFILAMS